MIAPRHARARHTTPTPRQIDIMATLADLEAEFAHVGEIPTVADVASKLGITLNGAREQLRALEAKGLTKDIPIQVSSGQWRLTPAGKRTLEKDEP